MEFSSEELNLISYTLRQRYYDYADRQAALEAGTREWIILTRKMLELDRLVDKIVRERYAA